MRRQATWLFLVSNLALVFAAPAAERTPVPTPLPHKTDLVRRKDDVIVNIGAVTTQTTVVQTAVPTTIYVELTTEGKVVTSTVVSTEVTKVQMVVTQTAVETQVVKETVQQGVTVPVTLTTTGYQLDIQTEVVQLESTVLETRGKVVTNTILGFENVKTQTVVQTKTQAPVAAGDIDPTPTAQGQAPPEADEQEDAEVGQDRPKETGSSKAKPSPSDPGDSKAPQSTSALGPNLNLNNSVDAGADTSASASNQNTNSNSVNVTLSSALSDAGAAKDWISQGNNGWIVGGGVVAVVLLIVGIIVAVSCLGGRSERSNPSQQSVFVANPSSRSGPNAAGQTPQPVMSSLASRPGRRQRQKYGKLGRVDEEQSSELSLSDHSGDDDSALPASRGRARAVRVGRQGAGSVLRR